MRKDFLIVVEGDADKRFISQYICHLFGYTIPDVQILKTNGKDNLKGSASINRMRSMTDQGGINLVIFDADKDFNIRKQEITEWKHKNNLEFELFLFPDNGNIGELEDWRICWKISLM